MYLRIFCARTIPLFTGEKLSALLQKAGGRHPANGTAAEGCLLYTSGIEVDDAQYMPQFADDVFRAPLPPKPASDRVNLVFAGNIGKVQALSLIHI